ncbi:MAG: hypothetical protein A3K45_00005 [Chloroflexi bacterium RIFOXYC12_FULL_59_14]|nr:MAG: hypothetical protein A3K45_00005 [Chloroflexi bacterium RIFOXYC12_FULL_59_14]
MIYQIKQSDLPKKLWNLIDAALRGEPVFIQRDDKALIQLLPLKQVLHPRKAGSAKGMIEMADDFDAPLDDFAEYMRSRRIPAVSERGKFVGNCHQDKFGEIELETTL